MEEWETYVEEVDAGDHEGVDACEDLGHGLEGRHCWRTGLMSGWAGVRYKSANRH